MCIVIEDLGCMLNGTEITNFVASIKNAKV